MKSFQKFIILFVFTSSAFANSFTDPHDSTKSYPHPSFVLYSDEPYRSLKAVPSNTLITNTEFWVSLKAEASQQTLPQGETPPETDTSQLTNTVPTNETPLVAPSFSVGSTASVNFQENGSSTVYTALATGADSYAISGGSDASLFTINTAIGILTFSSSPDYENPSDNGSDNNYSVKITATNSGGSSELSLSISVTDDTSDNAVSLSPLINISTNGYALTGAEKMSAGFIITGSEPMNVYIKAEKSQEAGITPLSDPKMEIWNISRTEKIAENDNWGDHENLSSIQSLDPGYYPIETTDSAVFLTLQPGAYLADVYGSQGNTGKALVAVNDVDDQSTSQLINISTNGYAYTGSEKMSAGFIITEAQKVYIKAEKSQEAGITPLSNPKMEIWDLARTTKIAENDDWRSNDNISEIESLPSAYYPIEETDSAVYITLQPGAYIADVFGALGNSGKAIIAVNKID